MKKLLFLFTSLLVCHPAFAELMHMTGNSWLIICGQYPSGNQRMDIHCETYTQGVIEGFFWGYMAGQTHVDANAKQVKPYCFSPTHTWSQYILVIKKHMLAAPEFLDKPAPWLIHGTMMQAFPCRNETP